MAISLPTVRFHVTNAARKLHAAGRSQAIQRAATLGYIGAAAASGVVLEVVAFDPVVAATVQHDGTAVAGTAVIAAGVATTSSDPADQREARRVMRDAVKPDGDL